MKNSGFSLVELLVVMMIMSILVAFGFNIYSSSRIKTQTKIERQYLLQVAVLVEEYFSENLKYPDNLDELLTAKNGEFTTPRQYYFLDYSFDGDNSYEISATLNLNKGNSQLVECHTLMVKSNGELQAFDQDEADITANCWN